MILPETTDDIFKYLIVNFITAYGASLSAHNSIGPDLQRPPTVTRFLEEFRGIGQSRVTIYEMCKLRTCKKNFYTDMTNILETHTHRLVEMYDNL